MSGCDFGRLEAFVTGDLPARQAREVTAHLTTCARCADEVGLLRAEQHLFAARAALPAGAIPASAAPPPFGAVLAAVRRERRTRWVARAPWLLLPAAAALALFAWSTRSGEPAESASAVAEPRPTFACTDDPASLALEATAYATDRAVASAEDLYGACLMATPHAVPAARTPGGACAIPPPSDVTCGGREPLSDEVFESRIRGGSLQ